MKASVSASPTAKSVGPSPVVDVLWTGDAKNPLTRRRQLPTPPFVTAVEDAWQQVSERFQGIDLFIYNGGKRQSVGCHAFIDTDGRVVNVRFREGDIQLLNEKADAMYAALAGHLGRPDQIARLRARAAKLASKNFPRRSWCKNWVLSPGDENNSLRLIGLLETHP